MKSLSNSESIDYCPICLNEKEDKLYLICDHSFCKSCLQKWQYSEKEIREKNNKNSISCPLCRGESVFLMSHNFRSFLFLAGFLILLSSLYLILKIAYLVIPSILFIFYKIIKWCWYIIYYCSYLTITILFNRYLYYCTLEDFIEIIRIGIIRNILNTITFIKVIIS